MSIKQLIESSSVHPEWVPSLTKSLQSVDQDYLKELCNDDQWLPGAAHLFAAFKQAKHQCRYILFGESPYPRAESANGIAFHDAAVSELWSDNGLSKQVNRATSLRNLIKTALVAEKLIMPDSDRKITQPAIAAINKSKLISTIDELFSALQGKGILLLNATPVLHPLRTPRVEARNWAPFILHLLDGIAQQQTQLPTLLLWGNIAKQIEALPSAKAFPKLCCEHPYNVSFIHNPTAIRLFSELKVLHKN